MENKTTPTSLSKYNRILSECKDIFIKKLRDYGISWRVLRTPSVIDQIYIKARRIRTIGIKKEQKISDDIRSEYIGIINYAVIGLIQEDLGDHILTPVLSQPHDVTVRKIISLYGRHARTSLDLFRKKNHDYGDAWREMTHESFTDLILVKLLRIQQIIRNEGKTIASEGIDSNLHDIINYAIFAIIRLEGIMNPL